MRSLQVAVGSGSGNVRSNNFLRKIPAIFEKWFLKTSTNLNDSNLQTLF